MKKAVLVTGGAGYIGSHVCKALKQAGFIPVTVDNLSQGHKWAVQWGPFVEMEIADQAGIEKVVREFSPFAVIHLASSINVRDSLKNPFLYYQNNLTDTLKFLEVVCASGIRYLVFSSSAAVYGQPHKLPIDEEHPKAPMHPYGRSKLMVEEILKDLSASHGLISASLRYFNAAGADPNNEIGEAHDPETHLIPVAIEAALGERSFLRVNGRDFPTQDGTAIRDYIHVSDLAVAHVRALLWIAEHEENLTLNLGTGQGYSVQEVIQTVEKIIGCKIPLEEGPRAPEDPTALVASSARAQKLLSWEAKLSSLPTIVQTAFAWHQKGRAPNGQKDENGLKRTETDLHGRGPVG